jgi:hypothetical protein
VPWTNSLLTCNMDSIYYFKPSFINAPTVTTEAPEAERASDDSLEDFAISHEETVIGQKEIACGTVSQCRVRRSGPKSLLMQSLFAGDQAVINIPEDVIIAKQRALSVARDILSSIVRRGDDEEEIGIRTNDRSNAAASARSSVGLRSLSSVEVKLRQLSLSPNPSRITPMTFDGDCSFRDGENEDRHILKLVETLKSQCDRLGSSDNGIELQERWE